MCASTNTTNGSASRPRTRKQWDEYYKNLHHERKRMSDGGKNWEKHGFVVIGEKRVVEEKNADSCGMRAPKRTRNVSENEESDLRSLSSDDEFNDESDVRSEKVVWKASGSKIWSESGSGSSSKAGHSDDGVNVVKRGIRRPRKRPLDVDCISNTVSTDLDSGDSSKSSDELNDLSMSESDEFSDEDYEASSSESSGGSDDDEKEKDNMGGNEKMMNVEGDSSSDTDKDTERFCSHGKSERVRNKKEGDVQRENNNESDEGYDGHRKTFCSHGKSERVRMEKESVVQQENDDDSDEGYGGDRKTFCNHGKSDRVTKKKESDVRRKNDNQSDEGFDGDDRRSSGSKRRLNQRKSRDAVVVINDDDEFPSVRKSRKIWGKTECEVELEREEEIDKGCHAIHEDSCDKTNTANWKTKDVEIIIDGEEKFPSIKTSVRVNQNKDDELDGLSRIYKSLSSYGCMEKGQKDKNGFHFEWVAERGPSFKKNEFKLSEKKTHRSRTTDFINVLVESINSLKENQFPTKDNALTQTTLPLRFRFEDEVAPPRIKSDWEKEIDLLFHYMELGLQESEIDCSNSHVRKSDDIATEIDQSPAACCARGEHQPILDEQIGIICRFCFSVILDIKYVLPPFYTPPQGRQDMRDYGESPTYFVGQIHFKDSSGHRTPESTCHAKGTIWDLIPGVKEELYPHQREGFEFMWKNIAGDIIIDKMKYHLPGGRGCIISHAPGTGKTRLTIVFLQTLLELYPNCCPVIIAPRGMLLTWESEFAKWNVDIPFHNLNKKDLSENENAFAAEILWQAGGGGGGPMTRDCVRLIKLASWVFGRSILGISYQLFVQLVRDNGEKGGLKEQIKELLLEYPGLLVLDEGHTPRNDQTHIWQALSKVATQRRIILSGTPFQNNLNELYNTLCIVNPKFVNQIESENKTSQETRGRKSRHAGRTKWMNLTSSIGKDTDDGLKKLRAMLDPFVHVHKGTILKQSLPGLRNTLVFLHPTELQKNLLEACSKERNVLHRNCLVSLVSVHPSLMESTEKSSALKSKETVSVDAGVKLKFVMKLIRLAVALGERVLIFSQYIAPLDFIKQQIKSRFSWNAGRELLYMDGQLDERQRQDSISSFNDDTSEAKVLLASLRACSEGINLVGASRVILLDTAYNPSVEKQAVSRAYRLGQKRVVYVYRLFTSGTEVRQYALQNQKERMSQLIFSSVDGHACQGDESLEVSEDKVLEAMLGLECFNHIFEKIIRQPKESDLIEIFGLVDGDLTIFEKHMPSC